MDGKPIVLEKNIYVNLFAHDWAGNLHGGTPSRHGCFNTKSLSNDLDDDWGYPDDFGNPNISSLHRCRMRPYPWRKRFRGLKGWHPDGQSGVDVYSPNHMVICGNIW